MQNLKDNANCFVRPGPWDVFFDGLTPQRWQDASVGREGGASAGSECCSS